jgi:hypothetical protein
MQDKFPKLRVSANTSSLEMVDDLNPDFMATTRDHVNHKETPRTMSAVHIKLIKASEEQDKALEKQPAVSSK